jgi:hypothetical protein
MRQHILNQINTALDERNSYFIREQDVQLYLASYFLQTGDYDNVFIEYHVPRELIPPYLWNDSNNIYIDIVLERNDRFYSIEIKFKTANQALPHLIFGQIINVYLGHYGAQNIGCYDFWKDLKRIEFFESTFEFVQRGLVLFISNDLSYQNEPRNPNVGYAPFSIHQGREVTPNALLNWNPGRNGNLAIANGRPGFIVNYNYTINWIPMNIQQHYYILT